MLLILFLRGDVVAVLGKGVRGGDGLVTLSEGEKVGHDR